MKPMLATARAETLYLLRDRTSLALILIVPLLQIILFGFAINLDPKEVTVAISGDRDGLAARVERILDQTGYFQAPIKTASAEASVRRGKALIGIHLPPRPDILDEEAIESPIRIYIDGIEPAAVTPALAALSQALVTEAKIEARRGFAFEAKWLFNPDRKTSWTIVPGLLGLIIMISMLMLGSLALVRSREDGSAIIYAMAPISPLQMLLGRALPYVACACLQAVGVLVLAGSLFDVPMRGPVLFLLLAVPLFALAHLALGFVFSNAARTSLEAIQRVVAFYLPAILLSGLLFPFAGMPRWAQVLGEAIPLTHMVRAMRDLMLRGSDWLQLLGHLWPITLFAALMLLLAMRGR